MADSTNSIEPNAFLSLLTNAINPDQFYENMTYLSGVAAITPWLFVVIMAWRLGRESMDGIVGKAALFEAFGSMQRSTLIFILYSSVGFTFFFALFGLVSLFEGMGSQQMIHNELLSFRQSLMAQEPEVYDDWILSLLKSVSWAGNLVSEGAMWTAYQGVSSIYVIFNQAIEMVFALGVGLTYVWGFIAIPTMAMKGELNLMKGWGLAVITLLIWATLEPILLGFLWLMIQGGGELVADFGSGVSSAAMAGWFLLATVTMAAVMAVKLFALFAAVKLANNEAPMASLGTMVGAPTMLAMNNVISRLQRSGGGLLDDMSPSSGGDRLRDRVGGAIGNTLNANMGDLGRSVKYGMGGLADRFTGSNEGGGSFDDLGNENTTTREAGTQSNMSGGDDLNRAGGSGQTFDPQGGNNQ